jgi:hypothetical protein
LVAFLGNSTLAWAAYRIYQFEKEKEKEKEKEAAEGESVMFTASSTSSFFPASPVYPAAPKLESDLLFWEALVLKSTLLALVAKYSSLYLPFLFLSSPDAIELAPAIAASLVFGPTLLNVMKWKGRSDSLKASGEEDIAISGREGEDLARPLDFRSL